jgi:hypothetical protein
LNIVMAISREPDLNRALAGWMEAKLGQPPFSRAIFDHGHVCRRRHRGALIFENYRPEDGTIEIGVAATSPRWLNRTVMQAMADFVFANSAVRWRYFALRRETPKPAGLWSGWASNASSYRA